MKKTFKALTCLALTFCMLTSNLLSANAAAAATTTASTAPITVSKKTIPMEDGGYCVVTLTVKTPNSMACYATKTKSASKSFKYYNGSNVLSWEYILHGTFMYDGTLVVCSDVSHEISIYNIKKWVYAGGKRWKQGNTAYGKAKFNLIGTTTSKTVNLEISSTKHGVIS